MLGGGTRSSDPPRPMTEVNEAGDRLLYAAKLYADGAANVVLVTGGSIEWLQPEDIAPEANDMSALMQPGLSPAAGSFTLKRLAFRIGDNEWADTSMVADDVQVRFKLVLTGVGKL